MQKKIRQLAEGNIKSPKGTLSFFEPEISLEVRASSEVFGEFYISSSDGIKIRGAVFSSDPRMECITEGFEGEEPCIRYKFNSKGLVQGDTVSGRFTIVSDAGEASLPFLVTVRGLFADTSAGSISCAEDFLKLYEEYPNEAYKLFYSSHFSEILTDVHHKLYYKGFTFAPAGFTAIEEFLVACDLKKPVDFKLSFLYRDEILLSEEREELLNIEKTEKGYMQIELFSSNPAVSFSKDVITQDDFIGAVFGCKVRLDPDKLFPGKNEIVITAKSTLKTKEIRFFARAVPVSPVHEMHINAQKLKASLTRDYIAYRLKQMMTGEWAARSLRNLDSLIALGESVAWYNLMKAQVYIANRQKQEALFILRDFKNERFERDTCIWAYYLYLSTLVEKERGYVERLTSEIEGIFKRNPEDERLFWMLLFLRPDYQRDSGKKFTAIRHWIENSHASPFLFVEAYFLVWQNPVLLSSLDSFNLSLLTWAMRHGALTRDIVLQLANLVNVDRGFSYRALRLLIEGYERFDINEVLYSIVTAIVRNDVKGPEYLPILKRAIKSGISVTGIYEAYLSSINPSDIDEVPRTLAMYFAFDHSLSNEHRQILYASIIKNKDNEPELYDQYSRKMEMFAIDAMHEGSINDNLAIIYNDLLRKNLISDDVATSLAGLLLSRGLDVPYQGAKRALIYQEAFTEPAAVDVINNRCYFDLSCENYVVIIRNESGYYYAYKSPNPRRMFDESGVFDEIFSLSPHSISYAVKKTEDARSSKNLSRSDCVYFETVFSSDAVSREYVSIIKPLWLQYLSDTLQDDAIENLLLSDIDLGRLSPRDRGFCIGLMIDYHMDDSAFAAVKDFGTAYIPVSKLMLLISFMIERGDMDFDEELYSISRILFAQGVHNTIITRYLSMHYSGPVSDMLRLYDVAKSYELEVFDIAEKLLTFMLFAGLLSDRRMEIFEEYFKGHPSAVLVEAFLTVECHNFLTRDIEPSYSLLTYLLGFKDQQLNDACRVGMLKLLSKRDELDDIELDTADKLLYQMISTGRSFSFFENMDYTLIQHYHLYDKTVAEYRGEAGAEVYINYELDGVMTQEEMTESYPGIYTKQFIIFFGEEKEYFITVKDDDNEVNEPPAKLYCRDIIDRPQVNRYERLNHIAMEMALDNRQALDISMREYDRLDNISNTLFTVIG